MSLRFSRPETVRAILVFLSHTQYLRLLDPLPAATRLTPAVLLRDLLPVVIAVVDHIPDEHGCGWVESGQKLNQWDRS